MGVVAIAVLMSAHPAAAQGTLELEPEACGSYSVLPQMFKYWQETTGWMGIAAGPWNPAQSVFLQTWDNEFHVGEPLNSSTYANETNLLIRNWTGAPDWGYVETYADGPFNYAHLIDWEPGEGDYPLGGAVSVNYGGLGWDCGLLRVWNLDLTAGQAYRFSMSHDVSGDDVRYLLLRSGGQNGWLGRADAIFERPSILEPGEDSYDYIPNVTGSYALVAFNNTITTTGGTYTLGVEETAPPVNPDLVVTQIDPDTAPALENIEVTVHVRNQGGAVAGASVASVAVDGLVVCENIPTPALAPGETALLACTLLEQPAGTIAVTACVDDDDDVDEGEGAGEENNCTIENIVVSSPGAYPNLIIEAIEPAEASVTQPVVVTVHVRNASAHGAGASHTRVYVDGAVACSAIYTPPIPAGQTVTVACDLGFLDADSYAIEACADQWNAIDEGSNELDNCTTETLLVTETGLPDLVIDRIEPDSFPGGQEIWVTVYVTNIGDQPASASHAALYVDGEITCTGLATPAVAAGQTVAVEACNIGVYWHGTHSLLAHTDVYHEVDELYDSNNNAFEELVVTPPASVELYPDGSGDFPTIQAAIDALIDGVTIFLRPGIYTGDGNRDVDFGGKDLVVLGIGSDPGEVVIDCGGSPSEPHRGFIFNSGEGTNAVVQGLTVTGGYVGNGAGAAIFIVNAQPTIAWCVLRGNFARFGGAVYCNAISFRHPSFVSCTLADNQSLEGAAALIRGAVDFNLANSVVAFNDSPSGPMVCDDGAAVSLSCSDVYGNQQGDFIGCLAGQNGVDGNFTGDPLFCDLSGGDFSLHQDSPCLPINQPSCGLVGAMTSGCPPAMQHVYVVAPDESGDYPNIYLAIQACGDGDVIELTDGVFTGTYNKNLALGGRNITIRSQSGNASACIIDVEGTPGLHARGFALGPNDTEGATFENFTIRNGYVLGGGGINAWNGVRMTLNGLIFENCHSVQSGGAVWATVDADLTFNYCTFTGCSSDDTGGAVRCDEGSDGLFWYCTFANNAAGYRGGGLYADASTVTAIGCSFEGNTAPNAGGGLAYWNGAVGLIRDCWLEGNSTSGGGGGLFMNDAAPSLLRVTFVGNTADWGGAGYCAAGSSPTLDRCTIYDNSVVDGGAAFSIVGSTPTFERTIIAFNNGPQTVIYCTGGASVELSCCDVWGNEGGDYVGCLDPWFEESNNIHEDPMFCLDDGPNDLTLHVDSPCADDFYCDQIGAWPVGCGPQTFVVRPDGTGDFPTIQEAVDACENGCTVELTDGVFTGEGNRDVSLRGLRITVRSQSGIPAQCVIDCEGSASEPHRGFVLNSGEYPQTAIEGLTIRSAYSTGGGGAILVQTSMGHVHNCVFEENSASDGGGIFLSQYADLLIEDCRFVGNTASNGGGGVRLSHNSAATITGCLFAENHGHWGAGALYTYFSYVGVSDCVFLGNTSDAWGGAVHCQEMGGSPISFVRCTFHGNAAPEGGALFVRDGGAIVVARSILSFSAQGAAVHCDDGTSTIAFDCSDLFGNVGGDWTGCAAAQGATSGNFSADPLFCDAAAGDLTVAVNSPCLPPNNTCGVQIGALGEGCTATDAPEENPLPAVVELGQNYPNPFNPYTTIRFGLPASGPVTLRIYDVAGRQVRELISGLVLSAGYHEAIWDGRDDWGASAASGLYFYRILTGGEVVTRKMLLSK